jgi:hypothetical protein
MEILPNPDRAKCDFARLSVFACAIMGWMNALHTSWFSVLFQRQKRFVLWHFFTPSLQGKQIVLKRGARRAFTASSDPGFAENKMPERRLKTEPS